MQGRIETHQGFTLVELLIVVIILATLAAIVVPQFGSTTADATETAFQANRAALSRAIETYRQQHNGVYPGAAPALGGSCVNGNALGASSPNDGFKLQLENYTDVAGRVCSGYDPDFFRFGPYLRGGVPENPYGGSSDVTVLSDGELGLFPDESGGWMFDSITGELIGNG
ncbi:MAG: type II secretion system protein [Pseudomonadota bacterium]